VFEPRPGPPVCQAWALIFSTRTFLAAVPTTCSRTVPCLKKRSVGML